MPDRKPEAAEAPKTDHKPKAPRQADEDKPVSDGDAIAEIGDATGGPA